MLLGAFFIAPTAANAALNKSVALSEQPVTIEADALSYNPEHQLVMAIGNVEIVQQGRVLIAEELAYDQITGMVLARGDVSLMEPDGNVYFADEVELKDDMKKGIIQHFNARMKDGSLLASNSAERFNKDIMQLRDAVYSPCKICSNGKPKTPTWQLKADEVTLNDEKERVYYKNATMEYYGVPILYTPYLSHAAPGADRKSGFLMPSYSSISTLGVTAKVPYYWSIEPNMDATITPFLTSNEGPVMIGEFRHLTDQGQYELTGSITNPKQRDELGFRTTGRDLRGHVEGKGEFAIKDDWVWGFNGKRSTDDTYLQRYKFGNEDLLTSRAYVNRLTGRNYITADGLTFQGLNAEDDPDTTPLVLPIVATHHETEAGWRGSRFMLDSNLMALSRGEGIESRRVSFKGGWKLPYVTDNGHSFEVRTSLRADGYHVSDVPDPLSLTDEQNGTAGRVIPETQVEWSLPLVKYSEASHVFVEPVANIILSPYGGNPNKIPNEDSQDVELSDVNLFSGNHFTGLDRVEGGPRANYGMRGGVYGTNGSRMNFLLGQSYRLKEDEQFREESGLKENFSDYVGRVSVNNGQNLELSYRFRLDMEDFDPHRNEIEAALDFSPLRLTGAYVLLSEDIAARPELDREEIASSIAYDLSQEWTVNGYARRDLSDDGGLISAGSGLVFHNECLTVSGQFGREFIRDRDIEPSTFFMLEIGFKNLN